MFRVQSWAARQELSCTLMSFRNSNPVSGVRIGVDAMGDEYGEEDSGDPREGDRK